VRLWRRAEGLKRKYSAPRYTPWSRRSGILHGIRRLYKKARDIVEDWAKKTAKRIVEEKGEAMRCGCGRLDRPGRVD